MQPKRISTTSQSVNDFKPPKISTKNRSEHFHELLLLAVPTHLRISSTAERNKLDGRIDRRIHSVRRSNETNSTPPGVEFVTFEGVEFIPLRCAIATFSESMRMQTLSAALLLDKSSATQQATPLWSVDTKGLNAPSPQKCPTHAAKVPYQRS